MTHATQVVVVGGGQAGLAAGYHLRRLGLDFAILDAHAEAGGAWQAVEGLTDVLRLNQRGVAWGDGRGRGPMR